MPSFIDRLHSKSSTTKPVLQKLCSTPKKWLSNSQKKNASKQEKIFSKDLLITKKGTKVHVNSDHSYENVNFSRGDAVNDISGLQTEVSKVTGIAIPFKKEENKLKSAIENFDKILYEYGKTKQINNKPPRLQKSRTCSIIESKCVLKKAAVCTLDKKLSKSLEELSINKSDCQSKLPQLEKKSPVVVPATESESVSPTRIKVKEVVNKMNSLSDTSTNSFKVDQISKSSLTDEIKTSESKQKMSLSKSVSSLDITMQNSKKVFSSKIPIKSPLNKTYPSTPSGLNILDRNSDSTQCLSGLVGAKHKFSDSVQDLKNHQTSKTHNKSTNGCLSGKTFRVQKMIKSNSVHNLQTRLMKTELSLPYSSLLRPVDNNETVPRMENTHRTKSSQNLSGISVKSSNVDLPKGQRGNVLHKTKSTHNLLPENKTTKLTTTKRSITTDIFGRNVLDMENRKSPSKSGQYLVNSAVEQFETSILNERKSKANLSSSTFKKVTSRSITQSEDTFGKKKSQYEPRFSQEPSLMSKKAVPQTKSKESIRNYVTKDVKDMRKITKTQVVLKTIVTDCDNLSADDNGIIVDEFLVNLTSRNKVDGMDLKPEEDVCSNFYAAKKGAPNKTDFNSSVVGGEIKDCTKVKDYSSDDNSYDSGNISNDHIAELSSLTSSSRNNSLDSLSSISRVNTRLSVSGNVIYNNFNSLDRSIDEEEIFFRSGVLTQLETQRDERLAGMVINLQAHCRGYLSRKKLAQKKLQDLAVRCIQRNVRKFMVVRDWPWWRLLVRVTPLLNVHRTEEELRNKTEELDILRAKVEKLEHERTTLKHENDKLEGKLSELTADLAEEHSTSTLAAERLDAETSERMRIERELTEVQSKNKLLQDASERLEMELLYAKSELNGISEEDEDGDGDCSIYKQRYERAKKELEFTRKRLQQQHEDDLEQLVGLKKQLEKKLMDAYEEVEEQRQVVGQWKRKVQKLNGETNDLRLLLEEQNARNNLLEKKQRKFDAETQLLQDELRQERQNKDRLVREKEAILAEKYTIESNLADVRLELDLKHDKLQALQRELDELTYGGKTEEEITILRKQKIDCERRLHDQDEELDELAGQVQLLEQTKLRLEMTLESQRKEGKKEAQLRDEELEEVRCNAQKKVKALEAQLENEHEERTILLREKHELERRLTALTESDRNDRAGDEALLQRLKRDLKRTKALLRDTQSQLERLKSDGPGKAIIRQLRNQVEDLECARSVAVKSKQSLEAELSEIQAMLDEANKQKNEAEERATSVFRERSDLQAQIEENEEELAEVMKKYKAAVQQMSLDQITLQEQVSMVSELEIERNHLREQLAELTTKLESVENMGETSSNLHLKRMELKTKELESKLDLEQTTRSRLEVQIARLKEAVDKLQTDLANSRTKEQVAQEQIRKLQRNLREIKEDLNSSIAKEADFAQKRKDLEKRCEMAETETSAAKADLKLALKRIEDLQSAIQGDLEDTSEHTDSEQDSYTSDESVSTFLSSKVNSNLKSDRSSGHFDMRRLSNASRSSTSSSMHGKDYSYA